MYVHYVATVALYILNIVTGWQSTYTVQVYVYVVCLFNHYKILRLPTVAIESPCSNFSTALFHYVVVTITIQS